MSIDLAIADAARNCRDSGVVAVVTLKSGVQYEGDLIGRRNTDLDSSNMRLPGGGWVTFLHDEVAAVESRHV